MFSAFPKIFAIGTDYIKNIFDGEVEISEKVDGSQFAFGVIDNKLYMRSKGAQLHIHNPEKMFINGIDYIHSIQDKMPNGMVYYGEYLNKSKHNMIKYDRVPKNYVVLFGSTIIGTHKFNLDFEEHADIFNLEVVPKWNVQIDKIEDLKSYMDKESFLGGSKIEGVVVKNYNKPFLLGGQPIPLMAGKYVSEAFKEVHKEKWGKENTASGKWDGFCQSFNTQARWQKAVQHLEERGELTNAPQDIGKLLKEINIDIESEEKDAIKDFLWNLYKRDIFKSATRGLPEWYKNKLLARSFSEEK